MSALVDIATTLVQERLTIVEPVASSLIALVLEIQDRKDAEGAMLMMYIQVTEINKSINFHGAVIIISRCQAMAPRQIKIDLDSGQAGLISRSVVKQCKMYISLIEILIKL